MTTLGDITIPAFVLRGLSTMDDPTDPTSVRFGPESDLRDALATSWWLHGMAVRVEVDVPKCGRIDVLGRIGHVQMLVELKREIKTPSQARKAFQQATTYKAFLDHEQNATRRTELGYEPIRTHAFVTSGLANWDVVFDAADVFSDVSANDFGSLCYEPINSYITRPLASYLREIAKARSEVVSRLASALRVADRNLSTALEVQNGIAA